MYKAHVEWITTEIGILRGGYDFEYGKPFSFVGVVIIQGESVLIKGFLGEYSKKIKASFSTVLAAQGFKKIIYQRIKKYDDEYKEVNLSIDLERYKCG